MRDALCLLIGLLPASRFKNFALRRLGYDVAPSASISPSLLIRVREMRIGKDCVIGPFNVLNALRLSMGTGSRIGRWNWLSAADKKTTSRPEAARLLSLGEHAMITSHHYLDSSGGITIGTHSTIAGHKSTFITHGISMAECVQEGREIVVGAYSIVSSDCRLTPGSVVPDGCLIAMGSVVAGELPSKLTLYAGVPARAKKPIDPTGKYFQKTQAVVD